MVRRDGGGSGRCARSSGTHGLAGVRSWARSPRRRAGTGHVREEAAIAARCLALVYPGVTRPTGRGARSGARVLFYELGAGFGRGPR